MKWKQIIKIEIKKWQCGSEINVAKFFPSWCHNMEMFSASWFLYEVIHQWTSDSLHKRPVMWSFDVCFVVSFNKLWNKLVSLVTIIGTYNYPDSKIHGANMGPTWVLSTTGGSQVGLLNLAIWVAVLGWEEYCLINVETKMSLWNMCWIYTQIIMSQFI